MPERRFSRYVINVADTMCHEFVTASAITRDTLQPSPTTSLRRCTPIRRKLIVTVSLCLSLSLSFVRVAPLCD